jgi:hypothetical protein
LQLTQQTALGTLPNTPPPPANISADGITNLQLINLNENFEVALFTSFYNNITNNVTGYQIINETERATILKVVVVALSLEVLYRQLSF